MTYIDSDLTNNLIWINQEEAAQGDTSVIQENSVIGRDFLCQVSQQWVIDLANAALLSWGVDPCQVAEV